MASYFRKKIAQKIVSLLHKNPGNNINEKINLVSTFVKVDRSKGQQPNLILSWKKLCDSHISDNSASPSKLITVLRNQGLPTAEGFIDIKLDESNSPHFIFTVDRHVYSKFVLTDIIDNSEHLIRTSCLFENISSRKILIACSLPSVGQCFNMTHFRSAIHSKFISNINRFAGHNVIHVRHINDVGLKAAILLEGYKKFGLEDELNENSPLHLSEVMKIATEKYNEDVGFQNEVKLTLEQMFENSTVSSEWDHLKNKWMQHQDAMYKRIGLSFDLTYFDSSYIQRAQEIWQKMLDEDLCTERFMSMAKFCKENLKCDELCFIFPTSEKNIYFSFLERLKKVDYQCAEQVKLIKLANIPFYGHKKWRIADAFLNMARMKMLNKLHVDLQLKLNESLEDMAENLGFSAICINDMKHRRNVAYDFRWSEVINFDKDSGASFQLCHAGLKGIEKDSPYIFKIDNDTSPLLDQQELELIKHLSRFDEMVYKSYFLLEPCIIFQYLSSLWYLTDQAANSLRLDIKENRLTVIKARLMLLSATLKVMHCGLELLGLTPLENQHSNAMDMEDVT